MNYLPYISICIFTFIVTIRVLILLANLFRRTAIEEMLHIEQLAESILFLKGEVEMKVPMMLRKFMLSKRCSQLATKMEESSAHDYNIWANECSQNADSVSKKLFETLVEDEERHFDQYDVEIENMNRAWTSAWPSPFVSWRATRNPPGGVAVFR